MACSVFISDRGAVRSVSGGRVSHCMADLMALIFVSVFSAVVYSWCIWYSSTWVSMAAALSR